MSYFSVKTLLFFIVCWPTLAGAVSISVELDRNPVSLNESFQVTYTATEQPDGNPDFEPLTRDFEILNQGHSSHSAWTNGNRSTSIQWTVQLMAKQAGTLKIPSINFGTDNSTPTSVTVTPPSSPKDLNAQEDLLLKVEAVPHDPYIQAQVLYTLRLYRKVNIAQARLDDPKLADAVVQKLGEDHNYNTQIEGVDYIVTERQYAIFPQKSGLATIEPLSLTAEVISDNNTSRFGGFFSQQITHTEKVRSNAVALQVRPVPPGLIDKPWLPASELQLKQEWSGDINQLKIGEPITRTLLLIAKGTTVGALPALNQPANAAQLKTYPDQPVLKETAKASGLYALREEKIAIIPSASGQFTLPAITVPWFNVQTHKAELATLPAVTLQVPATNVQQAPASRANVASNTTVTTTGQLSSNLNTGDVSLATNQANVWWMGLSLFLALGWLTTLIYLWRMRRQTPNADVTLKPPAQPNFAQALKRACKHNDMEQTKQILLDWAQAEFQVNSLGALAEQCLPSLRKEIQQLNQLLYAKQNTTTYNATWQGKALFQAFSEQQAMQKLTTAAAPDPLEPLHRVT